MFQSIQQDCRRQFDTTDQAKGLILGEATAERPKRTYAKKGAAATKTEEEKKDDDTAESTKITRKMSNSDIRLLDGDQIKEVKAIEKSEEFEQRLLENAMGDRDQNDVRIAVIGNVDSGKSTLVGVMSKGVMDDGRGLARQKVFNFGHEAANGRTSSIGQEIMGFDSQDKQVNLERNVTNRNATWAHIA
jgi:GTPase